MRRTYQPETAILHVYTQQMPDGTSFEVFVPSWANSIAIDKDGAVHAFASSTECLMADVVEWDTLLDFELVAELDFEVQNWQDLKFDLGSVDMLSSTIRGVFEVKIGEQK